MEEESNPGIGDYEMDEYEEDPDHEKKDEDEYSQEFN
jgi:hypothetical protein